jgi:hypothetical protein
MVPVPSTVADKKKEEKRKEKAFTTYKDKKTQKEDKKTRKGNQKKVQGPKVDKVEPARNLKRDDVPRVSGLRFSFLLASTVAA